MRSNLFITIVLLYWLSFLLCESNSFDTETFDFYTSLWKSHHSSWITNSGANVACNRVIYPTCINGTALDLLSYGNYKACPTQTCDNGRLYDPSSSISCFTTPQELIHYIPPTINMDNNDQYLCKASNPAVTVDSFTYGLDRGLPPTFSATYEIPLHISGSVFANKDIVGCALMPDIALDIWQVDAMKLDDSSMTVSNGSAELRHISCRNTFKTDQNGRFSFETTIPASYGPPRHIVFSVSVPHYQQLVTFIYFDKDYRLYQLTNADHIMFPPINADSDVAFDLGSIALDPRVAKLKWVELSASHDMTTGYFETSIDIYLSNLRPSDIGSTTNYPPIDIDGLWKDSSGAYVMIETQGSMLWATEYPNPRSWSVVTGVLYGDTIRGVDFLYHHTDKAHDEPARHNMMETPFFSDNIWSDSAVSTGIILQSDPYANDDALLPSLQHLSIDWRGGGYQQLWTKTEIGPLSIGYRYLKLVITDVVGSSDNGIMIINEIEFYEGLLSYRPAPLEKMISSRFPTPQIVSCSSFFDQHHCYKAFDGDRSFASAWISQPVGSINHHLVTSQYILFDFGPSRGLVPTAMRITCDVGNANLPNRCPMIFSLQGSIDNIDYDIINSQDLRYRYQNDSFLDQAFSNMTYYFAYESSYGRANRHRCGSCDTAPTFSCNLMSYDSSCASKYCGEHGLCTALPTCDVGFYLDTRNGNHTDSSQYNCNPCPSGRFGNTTGLLNSNCSGLCSQGYYCLEGSTTSTQFLCNRDGDVKYYCPEGSSIPLIASAGYYTINSVNQSYDAPIQPVMVRAEQELCELGHWCIDGIMHSCPDGYYGDRRGLSTATCTDRCVAGQYCSQGSIQSTICPKGYFCENGLVRRPCAAGRFGSTTGLTTSMCTGVCDQGYFCLQGSISATSTPCPSGRYGSETGLATPACSGPCSGGYYCLEGSISGKAHPCGSAAVYCQLNSSSPTIVSVGYYSTGGTNITSLYQQLCEEGYYCEEGVKYPCPAGTFGAARGIYGLNLSIRFDNLGANYFLDNHSKRPYCSGFCQEGYYCPLNSTSLTQVACPAGRYGETRGLKTSSCTSSCSLGSYCVEGSILPTPCDAGRYGNSTGLNDAMCSGLCAAGYWCPQHSMSNKQYECGSSGFYCPEGSKSPVRVEDGYYSTGGQHARIHSMQKPCDSGYYCMNGIKRPCPRGRYGDTIGSSNSGCSGTCDIGHYCPEASTSPTARRCPAGKYGMTQGLSTIDCSGSCDAGYYCPEGSTSRQEYPCAGVARVSPRLLSDVMKQYGINVIDYRRFDIIVTSVQRYSIINTLIQETSFIGFQTTISLNISDLQIVIARNLSSHSYIYPKQPNGVFCRTGSMKPTMVLPGYYATNQTKYTRSGQIICAQGSYCDHGISYNCPAGRYGDHIGLQSSDCSGSCPANFYCPPATINPTSLACSIGRYGLGSDTSAACSGACIHPTKCQR